jgi:hypothetical protein
MAKPICIITATGMICSASSIKEHFPVGHEENCKKVPVVPGLDEFVLKPFKKALDETTIPVKQRDAILRVVELMVTADAYEDTPFTIVNAG